VSEPPAPPAPVTAGTWSIDAVSPHFGQVGVATTVQLVGRFPSAAYVWFGDVPGTVLVASDRMMVVLSPALSAAGTVDISLRRTGEGTVLTVPGGFTYLGGSSSSSGTTGGGSSGAGSSGTGSGGSTAPSTGGGTGDGGGGGTGGGAVTNPGTGDGGGGGEVTNPGTGDGGGGGEVADPGTGDSGADGSSPTRLDSRQPRTRGGGEVVDLGNGLRGVMVDGANPMAGAPSCATEPCRI
jgi:hypothetical protein